MTDVEAWARRLIREARDERGTVLPPYGSEEWKHAPAKQRWTAILVAAECWRQEGEPAEIARRLRLELHAAKVADDQAYIERRDAHRREWAWLRGRGAPSEWRDDIDEPEPAHAGTMTLAGEL